MSQHILICTHCLSTFEPSPDVVLYYSRSCQPKIHIFCQKCVNKFKLARKMECKLCNKSNISFNEMAQLPSNPWNSINNMDLIGSTPSQIMDETQKCVKWWESQKYININRYKYVAEKLKKELKSETERNKCKILKFKDEIENLTKEYKSLQVSVNKYKNVSQNLKNQVSSLASQNERKTREFNNLNEKYTQMLRKKISNRERNNLNNYDKSHKKYKYKHTPLPNYPNDNNLSYDKHERGINNNVSINSRNHPYKQTQPNKRINSNSQLIESPQLFPNIPRKKPPKRNPQKRYDSGIDFNHINMRDNAASGFIRSRIPSRYCENEMENSNSNANTNTNNNGNGGWIDFGF